MKFLMFVGCSGSGKSTLARELTQANERVVVVSSDAVIEELALAEGLSYQEAFSIYKTHAQDVAVQTALTAFDRGLDVIWDQTNLLRSVRAKRLEMVPDGYEKIAVVFQASYGVLRHNLDARIGAGGHDVPDAALHMQAAQFEMPDFDEGFDRIMSKQAELAPEPCALAL